MYIPLLFKGSNPHYIRRMLECLVALKAMTTSISISVDLLFSSSSLSTQKLSHQVETSTLIVTLPRAPSWIIVETAIKNGL
jgi:hypothetical protein